MPAPSLSSRFNSVANRLLPQLRRRYTTHIGASPRHFFSPHGFSLAHIHIAIPMLVSTTPCFCRALYLVRFLSLHNVSCHIRSALNVSARCKSSHDMSVHRILAFTPFVITYHRHALPCISSARRLCALPCLRDALICQSITRLCSATPGHTALSNAYAMTSHVNDPFPELRHCPRPLYAP